MALWISQENHACLPSETQSLVGILPLFRPFTQALSEVLCSSKGLTEHLRRPLDNPLLRHASPLSKFGTVFISDCPKRARLPHFKT